MYVNLFLKDGLTYPASSPTLPVTATRKMLKSKSSKKALVICSSIWRRMERKCHSGMFDHIVHRVHSTDLWKLGKHHFQSQFSHIKGTVQLKNCHEPLISRQSKIFTILWNRFDIWKLKSVLKFVFYHNSLGRNWRWDISRS